MHSVRGDGLCVTTISSGGRDGLLGGVINELGCVSVCACGSVCEDGTHGDSNLFAWRLQAIYFWNVLPGIHGNFILIRTHQQRPAENIPASVFSNENSHLSLLHTVCCSCS
jgi:hypothetical protein